MWTVESLKTKAAKLAAEGRVHGLLWVMGRLECLGVRELDDDKLVDILR